MEYEYCPTCRQPLINEANVRVLRIRWGVIGGGVTVAGGVLGACLLPLLGFGSAGVAAGSWAASVQGPAVVAGSVFAICQSLGATGLGILLSGAVGTAAGGADALGLINAGLGLMIGYYLIGAVAISVRHVSRRLTPRFRRFATGS